MFYNFAVTANLHLMFSFLQEMKDNDNKKKGRGRGGDDDTEDAIGIRKKLKVSHRGKGRR